MIQTPYPKILRSKEAKLSQIEVAGLLRQLEGPIADRGCGLSDGVIRDRIKAMPPLEQRAAHLPAH